MNHEVQFKDYLRSIGERVTSPRVVIFRTLLRQSPISMIKLISKADEDGIDTVTVYRTMALLRRLGLVQEVGLGRNRKFELSDAYSSHHHHFTCSKCGKVTDFDSDAIEAELKAVELVLGFEITSHQLEAVGLCRTCLAT